MKTSFSRNDPAKNKIQFPCCKIDPKHHLIVLFTAPTAGTVIHSGTTLYTDGEVVSDWGNCSDETWEDFEGSVHFQRQ